MSPNPIAIACDLGALTPDQRRREADLLAEFRGLRPAATETPDGYAFEISSDPAAIARVGELVALERLCCPFLAFDLSVPAGRGAVTLRVHGGPGARELVRYTFFER